MMSQPRLSREHVRVKFVVIVVGSNMAPSSRNVMFTRLLPMWRLRSTCCASECENGMKVDTWKMISYGSKHA